MGLGGPSPLGPCLCTWWRRGEGCLSEAFIDTGFLDFKRYPLYLSVHEPHGKVCVNVSTYLSLSLVPACLLIWDGARLPVVLRACLSACLLPWLPASLLAGLHASLVGLLAGLHACLS